VIDLESHRAFLQRSYRFTRPIYDATRRYWLLGRDPALAQLVGEPWTSLVEVGPGTGRNLAILQRARPDARLGGLEPCDAMLDHARARLPGVQFVRGFAETTHLRAAFGGPLDRVLFSYCLSMAADPGAALDRAREGLSERGEVVVVDFGDARGLPGPVRTALSRFLDVFHVTPLDPALVRDRGGVLRDGPRRFYVAGRLR
jgi:S-adenosylmethionine-diacylgycerolhomoserine-N-methlytransferase